MKKRIFVLAAAIICLQLQAQKVNVNANRVSVSDSIWLNGKWIKKITTDAGSKGSNTEIPTTKYVNDRLGIINRIQTDTTNEPDYEIDIFPDIQNMTRRIQDAGRSMFQWVKDNKTAENIKAVLQVGDITDWTTSAEWDTATAWFNIFDGASIPYVTTIGNHDYDGTWNPSLRQVTAYNQYFGAARYAAKSYFGGYFTTDPLSQGYANSYYKFDAGSKKYFVLNLEFIPRDTVIGWAGRVLDSIYAAEPTREAIILTHAYITFSGELAADTSVYSKNYYGITDGNSGQTIWDILIKKKPNVKWVFSGHYLIPNVWAKRGLFTHIQAAADDGHLVNQFMVNFQDDTNWGNGKLMRMKFKPSQNLVDVSFYSPYQGGYDTSVKAFSFINPDIQIKSTASFTGSVGINKNLRVAGDAKFEQLKRNGIVFTGADHKLMDTMSLTYNLDSGLAIKGVGMTARPIMKLTQADSAKYSTPIFDVYQKDNSNILQVRAWNWTWDGGNWGSVFIGDSSGASMIVPSAWNGVNQTALGYRTLSRTTNTFDNTAIGSMALQYNQSGSFNTAIGSRSLTNLISGNDNVGVGQNVMNAKTTGSNNIAMGSSALMSSNGNDNVSLGVSSGKYSTGSYNVFIGRYAGQNNTGDRNVLIGYYSSGNTVAGSDQLGIDNTNTTSPLIEGNFATGNRYLKINGRFRIGDTYTPTGSADTNGVVGDLTHDNTYIYLKTNSGWVRFAGATF